ncbi:protein of unknown function [Candidatus Filomicrobium marinum]|uniref:Uncharacterized protein n=1 Tax=Candidatus Filomicrobium marinum TaxID=1608628 RepID=A0A0D6JKM3_9HYPH|nr:protein of unknown function [Candidatus Filomicrobium marinum]CPR22513.1 protein of unknown function [Candidatus Filomicrobium marinum]
MKQIIYAIDCSYDVDLKSHSNSVRTPSYPPRKTGGHPLNVNLNTKVSDKPAEDLGKLDRLTNFKYGELTASKSRAKLLYVQLNQLIGKQPCPFPSTKSSSG